MGDTRRRELSWGPAELRAARDRLGLTQGEMAYLLGVSELTITRWENPIEDQSRMPQPRLVRLAVAALETGLAYSSKDHTPGMIPGALLGLVETIQHDLDEEGKVKKGAA